jgi:hypothetical protein
MAERNYYKLREELWRLIYLEKHQIKLVKGKPELLKILTDKAEDYFPSWDLNEFKKPQRNP